MNAWPMTSTSATVTLKLLYAARCSQTVSDAYLLHGLQEIRCERGGGRRYYLGFTNSCLCLACSDSAVGQPCYTGLNTIGFVSGQSC